MSQNQSRTHISNRIANGAYTGFVEWRAPPDPAERSWQWIAGFFVGFGLKLALLLYLGAEFIPT